MDLSTERLILKEMTWEDVDRIHQLHSMKEVDEFNTIGLPRHTGDTLEVMLSALEDREMPFRQHFGWTLWLKETGEFVGEGGIHLSGDRFRYGDIHYSLLPDYWNKGYATEAVRRIVRFGIDALHLHRVQAGVATGNTRSIRVLEKAGMTCEGLRRKYLPIRGQWYDCYHYAIVEDDPLP